MYRIYFYNGTICDPTICEQVTGGDAIRRGDIEEGGVNVAASFLGISSLKNKVVLVAELK
jgi:hypothetical protein